MPAAELSREEQAQLLTLARQAITDCVRWNKFLKPQWETLDSRLRESGSTFVTLTIGGELRGCIGGLEAKQSLAEDVIEHAIAAAIHDYRFPPLSIEELDVVEIEISRLTQPEPLLYEDPEDLLKQLRPGIDGVIILYGLRRATFLPQVWEKIADPGEFLDHLCLKMGASPDLWRHKRVDVLTYQVEEFHE